MFAVALPFVRPAAPPLERVMARLAPSYEQGVLTDGPLVRELEARTGERIGCHAVAVSSCTAGLMLLLRVLDRSDPVVLPSFTFSASAHAVAWNGLRPVFAECDPESFQLDPDDAAARIKGAGTVMATHVFGAPCDVERLAAVADQASAALIYDAAHGFGAVRAGRAVGTFGAAEVFSLSPTKVVVAGEGGIVTTMDEDLAAAVRVGRNYGNPGNYDTAFVGLNARMSELHAAVALESLATLDEELATRNAHADRYRAGLAEIPGVRTQRIDAGDSSTYKDFTIVIDEDAFGTTRDELVPALRADGIDTRSYFSPPVHLQQAYTDGLVADLPTTTSVAARVVSLPMYRSLTAQVLDGVIDAIAAIQAHAHELGGRVRP